MDPFSASAETQRGTAATRVANLCPSRPSRLPPQPRPPNRLRLRVAGPRAPVGRVAIARLHLGATMTGGDLLPRAAKAMFGVHSRTTAVALVPPAHSTNDVGVRRVMTLGAAAPLPVANGAPIRQVPRTIVVRLGRAVGPMARHGTAATHRAQAPVDVFTIRAPNEPLVPLRRPLVSPRLHVTLGQ